MENTKRFTIEVPGMGKITATADAFNGMCCVLDEAAERYRELNLQALECIARKQAIAIHKELNKRHYYDGLMEV